MATQPDSVYTTPRNEAHLRDVLSRLNAVNESLAGDVESLESVLYGTGVAAAAITAGQVVYASSDGGINLASAATLNPSGAVGLAVANIGSGESGLYKTAGILTIPGWGLTVGAVYYLSTTPGGLIIIPNAATGQYIVEIGRALTSTSFLINPQKSILL